MTFFLLLVSIGFAVAFCVALALYFQSRNRLDRYQRIEDAEAYLSSCQTHAKAAWDQYQGLLAQFNGLNEQVTAQKNRAAQYQQLLGKFQTAAELHQRIESDKARVQKLSRELGNLEHADKLATFVKSQENAIANNRGELDRLSQLLGVARSVAEFNVKATEIRQRIASDNARVQELAASIQGLEHAAKLDSHLRAQEAMMAQKRSELESLSDVIGQARSVGEIAAQAAYYRNYVAQLKADVEAVEETKSLQEFGFYRPRFNFDSSDRYQDRLELIREKQKAMLSAKTACVCTTEWTVDGSKSEGKKMVNQQIKLMLRAFNGECDAAVSKVRFNNVVSLENRIQRSFEQVNKLGEAKKIDLSSAYCQLKLEELYLAHEYQEKKEEEKEEQRQIREQMREEQKVAKEIEKTCEAAEREEEMKSLALERARQELALKEGQHAAKLEELVQKLENELKEAIDRKAKAIARAQLTKSGHVYILSNIGTFGEGVFKIGMSRRLEPLERVDELGGASVPFPFDVHAMIYSEDAPALENALHRHFENRRVNLVNLRREFFRVTLDEIRAAVAEHFGHVTFVLDAEAEQYRQTLAKLKDLDRETSRLQIA